MSQDEFNSAIDAAILSGRSSGDIAREFGIRSETVRRRRSNLKFAGHKINHPQNTRRTSASWGHYGNRT